MPVLLPGPREEMNHRALQQRRLYWGTAKIGSLVDTWGSVSRRTVTRETNYFEIFCVAVLCNWCTGQSGDGVSSAGAWSYCSAEHWRGKCTRSPLRFLHPLGPETDGCA